MWGAAVDPSSQDVYVARLSGSVAKFTATGADVLQFNGASTPAGSFTPVGPSVDPATHDVYVPDNVHSVIDEFDETGKYLATITTGVPIEPLGSAINSNGDLYVVGSGQVVEFNPAGTCVNSCTPLDGRGSTAVAVDPSTNDVYVLDSSTVAVFSETGAQIEEFATNAGTGFGLAVNGTTHDVYLSDYSGGVIDVFKQVRLPSGTTGPAKSITNSAAEVCGTIDPESSTLAASYQFDYGTDTSYGKVLPASPVSVGTARRRRKYAPGSKGSTPAETYHYQLVASNSEGEIPGGDESFSTLPALASVDSQSTSLFEQSRAVVDALIDPKNLQTSYHIEYGTSCAYGSSIPLPDAPVGSGLSDIHVEEQLSGLRAGTVYHYRIVATSDAGRSYAPDGTFTTTRYRHHHWSKPRAPAAFPRMARRLRARSTPRVSQSSYEFDLGADTNYGTRIPRGSGIYRWTSRPSWSRFKTSRRARPTTTDSSPATCTAPPTAKTRRSRHHQHPLVRSSSLPPHRRSWRFRLWLSRPLCSRPAVIRTRHNQPKRRRGRKHERRRRQEETTDQATSTAHIGGANNAHP